MSEATTTGALVQAIGEIAWTCVKQCADHSGPPVMCVKHQLEAEELLKARLRERETPQWHAIETAPKDVLLLLAAPAHRLWDEATLRERPGLRETWELKVSSTRHWTWATHWRPLPSAPGEPQELK